MCGKLDQVPARMEEGHLRAGFRNIIRKQKNTDMQEFLWDGEMISFYQNSGFDEIENTNSYGWA